MSEARLTIVPAPQGSREAERTALKQEFLGCLAHLSGTTVNLRRVVLALLELGAKRRDLVQWAIEAGYSTSHVRSLLSRIQCKAGKRSRKPGAGRRTPKEAQELLQIAVEKHGSQAAKFLRAASRAAEDLASAQTPAKETSDTAKVDSAPRHLPTLPPPEAPASLPESARATENAGKDAGAPGKTDTFAGQSPDAANATLAA